VRPHRPITTGRTKRVTRARDLGGDVLVEEVNPLRFTPGRERVAHDIQPRAGDLVSNASRDHPPCPVLQLNQAATRRAQLGHVRELDSVAVGRALDLDAKGLRRACDDVQEAERRDVRVAIDATDMSVGRHGPPFPIRAMVSSGAAQILGRRSREVKWRTSVKAS
jgi:hypothetical protein